MYWKFVLLPFFSFQWKSYKGLIPTRLPGSLTFMKRWCFQLFYAQNIITTSESTVSWARSAGHRHFLVEDFKDSMCPKVATWDSQNHCDLRNFGIYLSRKLSLKIVSCNTFHITMRKMEIFFIPYWIVGLIFLHLQ